MTALRDRFAAFRTRPWRQHAGQAVRRPGARVVAAVTVLLAGAVALAPAWWWHRLTAALARPGLRWLPVLVTGAGAIILVREAVARWRRGGPGRGRPVAERVPLFGHVTVLLLLAAVVAVTVGAGMWLAFGRPSLGAAGGVKTWTVENTFDAIKIMLAVVAGIGGVVALTVAYRKQEHGEAAEQRENTRLFNDRFGRAADQLGSSQAAVRLAGVYAMAGLADDWEAGRQTCIDVLCAYLRMPYTPPSGDKPHPAKTAPSGLPLGSTSRGEGGDTRQEQQVRQSLLRLIREHLRSGSDSKPRWHGHRFDLRDAVIDGGDLSEIDVRAGTILNLGGSVFPCGTVTFYGAKFSGGLVSFYGGKFSGGDLVFAGATLSGGEVVFADASFSGGVVDFGGAEFSGGEVDFGGARFFSGEVNFNSATFSGSTVNFDGASFSGGEVRFVGTTFSDRTVGYGGRVSFDLATFSASAVDFRDAWFTGGTVSFRGATFSGGTVYFNSATFSDGTIDFTSATFSGSWTGFVHARFAGGTVDFNRATFLGGEVNFNSATFSGSAVNFDSATFTGSTVDFLGAEFSDGTVSFRSPRRWSMPPQSVDGSTPGVLWPSPEELAKLAAAS